MSKLNKFFIGIRESKLSRAQTEIFIKEANKSEYIKDNYCFEIKTIKTTGDIHNTHRLDRLGGKGLFIKEIEEQILSGTIDMGIHSLKDVPSQDTNDELELIYWSERVKSNDVLISNSGKKITELEPGSIVGTSSIRRRAQILHLRQDLNIKLLRGNVDTRLKKLRNKEYDAIILSHAGLTRMGLDSEITEVLKFKNFLPAACQGVVAVQAKKNFVLKKIIGALSNKISEEESTAERLVLKKINANCNSPVSIYANINKNNITIKFEIFDHHGNKIFKKSKEDTKENYVKLCDELGAEIINTVGQTKINELDNLKSDFDYTPS
jgi:hydroxymethylbilane synthase